MVRTAVVAGGIALLWPNWSPAVAYNAPQKMPGVHLVRPNDYNRMALAHLDIGQRRQSREILEEAIVRYPFMDNLVFPLSAMYIEDGNPQKAVTILQNYVAIRGAEDKYGVLRLANALGLSGRTADAMALIRGFLRAHPGDAEAEALLLHVQGKPLPKSP
jgi:tetratricopeptide (TPR) repeat protein